MTRLKDHRGLLSATRKLIRACGGDPESATAEVVLAEQDVGEQLEDFARWWARNNGYTKP